MARKVRMSRRRFIETQLARASRAVSSARRSHRTHRGARSAPSATAEEVTAGIDMSGKTVVVTGCNSGIGLETMRVLALRGAHVIGTARTLERGREACGGIDGSATPVVLELSDFDSVVACADAISAMSTPIDALICNAGVLLTELQQVRGLEMQFVVNHLGHFILTNRLLDRVTEAPQGRVDRRRQHVPSAGAARRYPVR